MNHTSRNVITTTRKRKDREDSAFYTHKGSFVKPRHYQPHQKYNNPATSSQNPRMMVSEPGVNNTNNPNSKPGSSNRILAGYLAHEFLTKGTLFGQKFDPARAEAMPVSAAEQKRRPGGEKAEPEIVAKKPNQQYAEVSQLLKGVDGAHIPGIVNPTQLARWIQM